jgi:endonuclease/exonuclease/phosphatase family metal-dependent hydrolase
MKFSVIIFFVFCSLAINATNISILSYNVNYSLINEDVVTILDTINADVVCLQETNAKWEKILRAGLTNKYPYIEFTHCCTAGGLAILSKYPIVVSNYMNNGTGWFPAWKGAIKINQDTIQLLNVHLKPGLTKRGRIGWNAYFKADEIHIQEIKQFTAGFNPNLPIILLGDFNENDKGKTMQWLKEEMNCKDALSLFNKRTKTWRFVLLRGRYDHMFFNQRLTCTNSDVYKVGKSDHLPLLSEFVLE